MRELARSFIVVAGDLDGQHIGRRVDVVEKGTGASASGTLTAVVEFAGAISIHLAGLSGSPIEVEPESHVTMYNFDRPGTNEYSQVVM